MNYEQMLASGDKSKVPLSVRLKPFWNQDVVILKVAPGLTDVPSVISVCDFKKTPHLVGWWNGRPFLVGVGNRVIVLKEDAEAKCFPPGVTFEEPVAPPADSPPPFTALVPSRSQDAVANRPLIINVRGTSGSGKSHLIREVMARYKNQTPVFIEGRKRPMYYKCQHPTGGRELCVLGHYESPCGGCDTINGTDLIFNTVRELARLGYDVLFEGLLISIEVNRTNAMANSGIGDVSVICLNTPLETCIASINSRRAARGKTEPVNPDNTASKHRGVVSAAKRLNPPVNVGFLDRDLALKNICLMLGV